MGSFINLNRIQLAKFLPDQESIRKFEEIIALVNQLDATTIATINAAIIALGVRIDDLTGSDIELSTTLFNSILSAADTDAQKAFDTIDNITTTNVPEGSNLYYTNARFDSRLATKTTTNLTEGANLYYTEARVNANRKNNILEYGLSSVTANFTVTKTKTVFTGSTTGQTITLPTAGTAGREIEVFNNGTVLILISGSSTLSELYANESACFVDTGSDWIA